MTDASLDAAPAARPRRSLTTADARTQKRNAAEKRFRMYGMIAIGTGIFFLVVLAFSILRSGLPAFTQYSLSLDFTLTQEQFDEAEGRFLKTGAYEEYFNAALQESLAQEGLSMEIDAEAVSRIVGSTGQVLREHYLANPGDIGQPVSFTLPTSSRVDGYFKGRLIKENVRDSRFITVADLDAADALREAELITTAFNWTFITGTDTSVQNPGSAGIGVSVVGSFAMMLVVLGLSLPIGVAASIYLEEFAPQNRFTDFIEVNISNLAAVPSIVFGILGLAVFIQFSPLPQSAPLVGGLTLTLMTLPTIVISTRASLKAVPPSIRDAALGVGASKMQAVFHHVLPLAMPGILTGTIIGLAQALGETAPLLLIGMVGLIATEYPDGFGSLFLDPNSAMPAQIYTWAARSDDAFYEKAWGGIIVLLIFLLVMNLLAILLRRRFERRW
jgi:phosphate transport system permease protein